MTINVFVFFLKFFFIGYSRSFAEKSRVVKIEFYFLKSLIEFHCSFLFFFFDFQAEIILLSAQFSIERKAKNPKEAIKAFFILFQAQSEQQILLIMKIHLRFDFTFIFTWVVFNQKFHDNFNLAFVEKRMPKIGIVYSKPFRGKSLLASKYCLVKNEWINLKLAIKLIVFSFSLFCRKRI